MDRCVAEPLQILLAGLRPVRRRPGWGQWLGLGVGVDVAELTTKADIERGVATGEVLLGVAAKARLRALLDRLGDPHTTAVRCKDPLTPGRHASPLPELPAV